MALVVKIDLEKNKENYQAVIDALAEYDIVSAAWQDEADAQPAVDPKLRTGKDGDLGAAVSSAVDRMVERSRSRGQ